MFPLLADMLFSRSQGPHRETLPLPETNLLTSTQPTLLSVESVMSGRLPMEIISGDCNMICSLRQGKQA